MSSSSKFPNPCATPPDSQSVSYQTHVSAGHKKFQVSFSFSGFLEEVVLTMSHCLTALNPKLLGIQCDFQHIASSPHHPRGMAWQGEKHSLLGGAFHKEIPYSLHSSQGQHPHQAMQRSQFSVWQVRRSRNGCNFTRFVCCMAQIKGCRTKNYHSQKLWRGFFHFELQLQIHAGKLTLGGWRRKEKLNTTDCCHWIWLCSKVCWS